MPYSSTQTHAGGITASDCGAIFVEAAEFCALNWLLCPDEKLCALNEPIPCPKTPIPCPKTPVRVHCSLSVGGDSPARRRRPWVPFPISFPTEGAFFSLTGNQVLLGQPLYCEDALTDFTDSEANLIDCDLPDDAASPVAPAAGAADAAVPPSIAAPPYLPPFDAAPALPPTTDATDPTPALAADPSAIPPAPQFPAPPAPPPHEAAAKDEADVAAVLASLVDAIAWEAAASSLSSVSAATVLTFDTEGSGGSAGSVGSDGSGGSGASYPPDPRPRAARRRRHAPRAAVPSFKDLVKAGVVTPGPVALTTAHAGAAVTAAVDARGGILFRGHRHRTLPSWLAAVRGLKDRCRVAGGGLDAVMHEGKTLKQLAEAHGAV